MAIHLVVFDFMVPTLDSVYQVVLLNSKVAVKHYACSKCFGTNFHKQLQCI